MSEIRIQNTAAELEYITSASVDDIREEIERHNTKTKVMFLISVCWSGGRTSEILKCYKDFFHLQCSILDEFPVEGGRYNKIRTIPYLPGRKIFRKDDLGLAQERKPDLDSYVKQLIKLDPIISQSRLVLDFFEKGLECEEYGTNEQLNNICKENTVIASTANNTKHEGLNEIFCYVNTCCETDVDEKLMHV